MNYQKFTGLKQHNYIILQFWRPEVRNPFHWAKIKVSTGLQLLEAIYIAWLLVPSFTFKASSVASSLLSDICFHPYIFSFSCPDRSWGWWGVEVGNCCGEILVVSLFPREEIQSVNLSSCLHLYLKGYGVRLLMEAVIVWICSVKHTISELGQSS